MKILPLLMLLHSLGTLLSAQETFPPFKDGVYYSYEVLKNNTPDICFDSISLATGRLDVILENTKIGRPFRFNKLEIREYKKPAVKVEISNIWALCYKKIFYIRAGKELVRIIKFGSLCHFTMEEMSIIKNGPFFTHSPGEGPAQKPSHRVGKHHRADQFILDLETGDILPFELDSMTMLLKRDPALFEQFQEEPQKEERLFIYLVEYNRRNPVIAN